MQFFSFVSFLGFTLLLILGESVRFSCGEKKMLASELTTDLMDNIRWCE